MLNFKVIGCGAAGNKAAIDLIESGFDPEQVVLLNSTYKDVPEEYRRKTIIFGKGLGGCGKERSLGKKMLYQDLMDNKINPESMISSRDKGVVLVGSTEGGSGSSAIPILAKYFKEVEEVNVICVLFFGFKDDTRGLQNTIELAQELSTDFTVVAISNSKFLPEANNNKFKAEALANKKFIEVINILNGSIIKPGVQVIDDTDLYKLTYTPGYLIADTITLTNLGTVDDFNSIVVDAIKDSKFINPPANACANRRGLIFEVEDQTDCIDYDAECLTQIFGMPYEKYTNLYVGGTGYKMSYIISGMKLPVDELTTLYNNYIENSKKVDKREDDFFSKIKSMRGNAEDVQFDMFGDTEKKKKSKQDFFSSIQAASNTTVAEDSGEY